MGRPVGELQASISSSEFTDWIAFYRLEPWGYDIDNWRAANVAVTVAQAAGAKLKLDDFLPVRRRATDASAVEAAMQSWIGALGGKPTSDS